MNTANSDDNTLGDSHNAATEHSLLDIIASVTHSIPPSSGTQNRKDETNDQAEQRLEKMCGAVKTLLECVGEDPSRPGLLATPSRYAKALLALTAGYQQDVEKVTNNAIFQEDHKGLVIVKDIEIHSLCEHHLLPFTGKVMTIPDEPRSANRNVLTASRCTSAISLQARSLDFRSSRESRKSSHSVCRSRSG